MGYASLCHEAYQDTERKPEALVEAVVAALVVFDALAVMLVAFVVVTLDAFVVETEAVVVVVTSVLDPFREVELAGQTRAAHVGGRKQRKKSGRSISARRRYFLSWKTGGRTCNHVDGIRGYLARRRDHPAFYKYNRKTGTTSSSQNRHYSGNKTENN